MTRWEYKLEYISSEQIENQLNFIGKDGWELVSVEKKDEESLMAIFKRSINEQPGWFKS